MSRAKKKPPAKKPAAKKPPAKPAEQPEEPGEIVGFVLDPNEYNVVMGILSKAGVLRADKK